MPTRTLALIGGLIILTVVLLFAATRTGGPQPSPVPTPKVAVATPTPTPPAYTTLSLSPNPLYLGANGRGSIQIMIDTDANTISGVQIELAFDPKALTNITVTPGTFFQNPLIIPQWNKVDTQTGRISHAQVLSPTQPGIKGKGVVATISFTKISGTPLTQTTIDFLPKTAVTQPGTSPSVLKTTNSAMIYFATQSQSSSPQPTQPAQ